MTPELHPAIGPNRYCGPGALAILTGLSTSYTAMLLRNASGKRAIKGIGTRYMLDALRAIDLKGVAFTGRERASLRSWALDAPPGRYLVHLTGHYVVVRVAKDYEGRVVEVCDNQSVYPLPVDRFKRGKRVRTAWRIEEVR